MDDLIYRNNAIAEENIDPHGPDFVTRKASIL